MSQSVMFEADSGVATITLNRPERLNAWNDELVAELSSHLESAASPDVRAVVLTGAGRAFSSGADLRDFAERAAAVNGKLPEKPSQMLKERFNPLLMGVKQLEKPVIAAVNGPAAGIGLSLALACDLIVANESATFMLPFVSIGLTPDGGCTASLPASVGLSRAFELALLGEAIDAKKAEEIGLIARVLPDDRFEEEVKQLAAKLANGPTLAYANTKRALNESALPSFEAALNLEAELQDRCFESADFLEGVAAFLEKRTPSFSGK